MSRFEIDITERLRWDQRYTNGHVPLTLEDAAKEIERLRRALWEIEGWTGEYGTRSMARAALNIQQRAEK